MQAGVWSPCRYYTELNSHVKLRARSMNMYRAVFTWLYYRRERQFAFEVGQIELKLLALSMPARRKLMSKNTDKVDSENQFIDRNMHF